MPATIRLPIPWPTLRTLIATGVLYLIMMGSTFSSLGVVLPHMIQTLHMNFGEAGVGFTSLALAAAASSMLPSVTIRRWSGRVTIALGVLVMVLAYLVLAVCPNAFVYDVGAALLGLGFELIGAVPALHILGGLEVKHRAPVFGAYLAFGGLGGALWPTVVEGSIATLGDWRGYWWAMAALMAVAGAIGLPAIAEDKDAASSDARDGADSDWTLGEAARTPQFYVIGSAIAATYLISSTVNAFTVSYLTLVGVTIGAAVVAFSILSACHAVFPLLMGGIAERVGAKRLLVFGVSIQAIGMTALALNTSFPALMVFAIGVGGGYGTIFLSTTLSLQEYFGHRHYARIFGANQLFTGISVVGPAIVGRVADLTGRFDISWAGLAVMLAIAAIGCATLRRPARPVSMLAPVASG